jgi:hypothetical protein
MELKPFCHEAQIALSGDFTLHLVFDFASVDRLERLLGQNIDTVISEAAISISGMVKVLWAITRKYHEDLTLDQIAGILLPGDATKQAEGDAVAALLGDLIKRAFLIGEDVPMKKRTRRNG